MRRRIFAATAACVMAFGVSSALAASTSVTLKLKPSGSKVYGEVKSSKDSCEKNRTVKLYYGLPGGSSFSKVADDTSDSDGDWSIKGPGGSIPTGDYYVKVTAKGSCADAKSSKLKVRG